MEGASAARTEATGPGQREGPAGGPAWPPTDVPTGRNTASEARGPGGLEGTHEATRPFCAAVHGPPGALCPEPAGAPPSDTRAATLLLHLQSHPEPPRACHTEPTVPPRACTHQSARILDSLSCHVPVLEHPGNTLPRGGRDPPGSLGSYGALVADCREPGLPAEPPQHVHLHHGT